MNATQPSGRWRALWLLATAELLAMALWFSASAVKPRLIEEYQLSPLQAAGLTISVQLGFVVGAFISAVANLADRLLAHRLFASCALLGALFNAAIAAFDLEINLLLLLRFCTGMMLAGVYPTGMKLMATWFKEGRGLAIGVLVGALTIGSASPQLLTALLGGLAGLQSWRLVLWIASASALLAAMLAVSCIQPGPLLPAAARFDWKYAGRIFTDRPLRLANFGYLGHMWELYAMWTWIPTVLLGSYGPQRPAQAAWASFATIAVGGLGSYLAGAWADRVGRTRIAMLSLLVSGGCCLLAGFALQSPYLLTAICLVWGFAVVADSAQFSTAVSELCDSRYVGTALTIQTCTGFLLTTFTIWMLPPAAHRVGWQAALALLAIGPVFGMVSMALLRRLPEATRMASGQR